MKKNAIFFGSLTIILIISLLGLSNFEANYMIKQIVWIGIGLLLFFVIKKININVLLKYSGLFYLANILLLFSVLLIGKEINGSKAWFSFGAFSLQPSEVMKVSLALIYYKISITSKKNNLIKIIILCIIPSLLVFLEPDTGAIIMFFIIMVVALFNCNIKKKYLVLLSILFLMISGIFIAIYYLNNNLIINIFGTSIFYRIDRIIHFKNNYQLNQALIYLGSAGLFGHKNILYVPESHTDFFFSFLVGRYGIIMGIIIIVCFFVLDWKLIDYSKNDLFSKFLFYLLIFSQTENIMMNIGLLPIMGIPLSFLSYGGTNTIILFVFLGLIANKKAIIY